MKKSLTDILESIPPTKPTKYEYISGIIFFSLVIPVILYITGLFISMEFNPTHWLIFTSYMGRMVVLITAPFYLLWVYRFFNQLNTRKKWSNEPP